MYFVVYYFVVLFNNNFRARLRDICCSSALYNTVQFKH